MTAPSGTDPPTSSSTRGRPSTVESSETINLTEESIVQASVATRAVWLTDDAVVLDVLTDRVFRLNSTAGYVWSLLQQPRRIGEIKETVRVAYGIDRDETDGPMDELLRDFLDAGLIGTTGQGEDVTESIVKQPRS